MAELWDVYDKNRVKQGTTVERGNPLTPEEYHIVVQVWIRNREGKWLISRRTPNKPFPLYWETTGGSVVAGEDSLTGAIREAEEELGVHLSPDSGRLYATERRDYPEWEWPGFLDSWVFHHDCDLSDIVFQEGETCDARWVDSDTILRMMEEGEFVPERHFPYLRRMFREYQ